MKFVEGSLQKIWRDMVCLSRQYHFKWYVRVRIRGQEMFVFWKIWRALLSCYLRFEIRPFALLLTKTSFWKYLLKTTALTIYWNKFKINLLPHLEIRLMKMSYLFVNCKWFCLEVLLKELVVSKNERTICTKTYKCHNLID